jgi:CPA2 family monovalent cation:H+ antiporter-2
LGIAADFVLILVAGLLGGILARLARLPLLVGYVLAGVFVGPYTSGPTVAQIHDIELLAEIGAALLLFSLGLEVSFRDLKPVRGVALVGGPIQILLVCAVGALAASYGLGLPNSEAVWFGAMISLSSTMVVMKMLSVGGVTTTLASRVMIGLLVIQDLAVVPMLIVLPQLANPVGILTNVLRSTGIAAISLALIYFLGMHLLPRLLKAVLVWGARELFLVTVVTTGVGIGFAAYRAGLSFALGAFVAGIVLSESEFSHQALSDVIPLRDIFGLLFFVTVGMLFDPSFVMGHVFQVLVVVAGIFIVKASIIGVVTRLFGYTYMAPWIVGLGLSQIGEFSFVLARTGVSTGSISKVTYDLTLTCTILTMALAPLVSRMAFPLGRAWQRRRKKQSVPQSFSVPQINADDHVIVGGYGRTGRAVARALREANVPFVVVDVNHALLADMTAGGFSGIWGDITSDEILRAAHVERAQMLLLTMPDQNTVHVAIVQARGLNPAISIIARAAREQHLGELRNLGVVAAVQAEFEGGVEMVRQALMRSGQADEATLRILDRLRKELYGTAAP